VTDDFHEVLFQAAGALVQLAEWASRCASAAGRSGRAGPCGLRQHLAGNDAVGLTLLPHLLDALGVLSTFSTWSAGP